MLESTKLMRFVSIVDPALTKVPEEIMSEYGQKREIDVVEKYFDGAEPPIVYHARAIPRSIWNRFVLLRTTDEMKAQACFQYGIVRVDNLPSDDGVRISFAPTGSVSTVDGDLPHITDSEMNRFYPAELAEIGGCIYMRNFFRPTIDVIYQPPRMSVEQWARRVVLSADANRTTQVQSNDKRFIRGTQPQTEIGQKQEQEEKK